MSNTLAPRHADTDSLILKFIQPNISGIMNFWANTNILPFTLPEKQIILFGEIIAGWRILQPLPITIEQSEGLYIVSDEIFDVYGDGETEYKAVEDYKYHWLIITNLLKAEHTKINKVKPYLIICCYISLVLLNSQLRHAD